MKGEELGRESGFSFVPRDVGRDGTFPEYGHHVLDSVRVLRVLLQHLKESRVGSRVEHAESWVVL